ncbi:MAG TPA: threonine ammonia-lyase [Solirubrobacteraceae bacterium]|nr:threonine ammonia-lyase [Solirubrobacteraceae bacterium]
MASTQVSARDIERVRAEVAQVVRRTPVLDSWTLSEQAGGGDVVLKAESLQRTGSFKVRGAIAKLAALGERAQRGVIAGSAGNHARAVAFAARQLGVPCEVVMPPDAPIGKIEGCRSLGATVLTGGQTVDACVAQARERASERGMAFIHPFDDPDVIAGQGTLGLELLEQVPQLARVVVPVGGGGLASGTAIAVKSARPEVEVIGVQAEVIAAFPPSLAAGAPVEVEAATTIADGIALRRPGDLTLPLVAAWLDGVVTVGEDDIAEAMVLLPERAKLVVEGGGAVGVAALMTGAVAPARHGTTCVVLSGGNVDAGLLAAVARLHESRAGRRLVVFTRVPDRPGGLARLLVAIGDAGANLIDVEHVREGVQLHVRETGVQLVLETRGPDHAARVLEALGEAGYLATVMGRTG